ncbi:MAG: YbjQ family protein [Nanoarchaeota archaeon]|nr:YbjQ family protein [Nanoarchaeota archaeon]
MTNEIIVTTGNDIPGKKLKVIGIVKGNTVRSRNIGRDIAAAFKGIIGGEIRTFTELISQSRDEAYNRMVNEAIKIKADGIIAMRFGTSSIMANSSEILAYGTAVKFI